MLVTTLVLNIKSAVSSEFEKLLVIDKVELPVPQQVRSVVLTADQVSFGYRQMPQPIIAYKPEMEPVRIFSTRPDR